MENKLEFGKKDIVSTIIIENYERLLDVKKSLVLSKHADNIRTSIKTIKQIKKLQKLCVPRFLGRLLSHTP